MKAFIRVKLPMLHPMTWARDIVDPAPVLTVRDATVI